MITRHLGASLALASFALASGCCHPFCKRTVAPPAVVSSSPICCPPGGAAPAEPTAVPAIPPPPPVQSFSAPPASIR
jgi:hypothetical protein